MERVRRDRHGSLLQLLEDCVAALGRGGSPGLVLVDVAGLEQFNRVHGEEAGDRVLARLRRHAGRVAAAATGGCRVYRVGGDEFGLLVEHATPEGFRDLVRRLGALRLAAEVDGAGVGLRLGAARAPEDGTEVAELLAAAVQRLRVEPCPAGDARPGPDLLWATRGLVHAARAFHRRARRYAQLAHTDPLTGLPNQRAVRAAVRTAARRARRTGRPFAVVMVDGDGLKQYNSRLGYEAANAMIRRLGRLLRRALPREAFLGRWLSGDEFIAVVPGASARAVAERLCGDVARHAASWPIPVTVSVGIARCPEHGDDPELLLRRAAAANDLAKARGKNRVVEWEPA